MKEDIARSKGKDVNAQWLPDFAPRLIADVKWLPLWSCVTQEKFRYGGVPASSAHIECEFKNIKIKCLTTKSLNHLRGTIKILHAAIIEEDGVAEVAGISWNDDTDKKRENITDSNGIEIRKNENATDLSDDDKYAANGVIKTYENENCIDANSNENNNSSRQEEQKIGLCKLYDRRMHYWYIFMQGMLNINDVNTVAIVITAKPR